MGAPTEETHCLFRKRCFKEDIYGNHMMFPTFSFECTRDYSWVIVAPIKEAPITRNELILNDHCCRLTDALGTMTCARRHRTFRKA